ncbi:fungal hydrophobin [Epithele typhae]|uniref:fungal hydrophobin n=1 Tax=Epithele typhae TaxID=378194 RepID=UPI0020083A75|nr:fungal hydrophobin [Epithele typhae]KAH9928005.1 fungal hydrophobin [Epithele typhae]
MFSKLFIASAALFAVLANASPVPDEVGPAGQCNTGSVKCCDTVGPAKSVLPQQQLDGLLGVVIQDLNVIVGVSCIPISVIGVGAGNTCSAKPVCCESTADNGLINIGCLPITL